MEIDEIVDYATKSPENTNPAVLRSMLRQLNNGSSSGGSVYVIETVYDDELMAYKTVKTAAQLYEEVNAVSVNGAPVMITSVGWGTPYDVLVETYRSEDAPPGADPEGYTITMTSLGIPDDSDSTSLSLIQYWERVPMSDANDHPFVFSHYSNNY